MKEKKVLNKPKWNFTLSQSKENFVDIEKEVQDGVELLTYLTSSVLHTSTSSSSWLNLPAINVNNKQRKVGEELLSVTPHVDTLSPLKTFFG